MKWKKAFLIIFMIIFLTSLTKTSPMLVPKSQRIEDPITIFHRDILNLNISSGTEEYTGETFIGDAKIYGNVIATFNYCTFNLSEIMDIFGNAKAIFNNCTIKLTGPTDPMSIFENATSTFYNNCAFELASPLQIHTTSNATTFENCTLGLTSLDIYGSTNVTFVSCKTGHHPLKMYEEACVSMSQCTLNFTEIRFLNATKVTFRGCSMETNAFCAGDAPPIVISAINYSMDTGYPSAEISLLDHSNLTIHDVPTYETLDIHRAFFCGNASLLINDSKVVCGSPIFEVHEDATCILNHSVLKNVISFRIMERANVIVENSSIMNTSNIWLFNLNGWYWDSYYSPHDASLKIIHSNVTGPIMDMGENTSVTVQDSAVDIMAEQLWVNGSLSISNNRITSAVNYRHKNFTIEGNSTYNATQYLVIGTENATITIESSSIYAVVAAWDAEVHVSNSTITDFVAAVDHPEVVIKDTILRGEGMATLGFVTSASGTVGGEMAIIFSRTSNINNIEAEPLINLMNCTVNGFISSFGNHTIVLQNSNYDPASIRCCDEYFFYPQILIIESASMNVNISGWVNSKLNDITSANFSVNSVRVEADPPESLQFTLDPLTHQVPGLACFEFEALNGEPFSRNFTVEIPALAPSKCVSWNTTSDFANYANNNCTIGTNNVTLTWVNATGIAYDFTDDSVGGHPSGWFVWEGPNTHMNVHEGVEDHAKVVEINDSATANTCYMINTFGEKANGAVEFWLRSTAGWSGRLFITFRYEVFPIFRLDLRDNGELRVWGPFDGTIMSSNWADDQWYHVRVEFNCTTDKFKVWLDGTYQDEYDFYYSSSYIEDIRIEPIPDSTTGFFYLDAIDYSWAWGYYPERSYYTGHPTGFLENGTWTSNITDLEDPTPYHEKITFSCDSTASTAVLASYRMSNDGSSWVSYNGSVWETGWSAWTNNNVSLNLHGRRYFQVRTLLNTSNATQSPALRWINVSYHINFGEVLWNTTNEFQDCANNTCAIGTNNLTLPLSVKITYDFTNDANGSEPSGWTVEKYGDTHCLVNQSQDGHSKVVEFWDDSDLNIQMYQSFTGQATGTIEFWIHGVEGNNTIRDYFFITFYDDQWCENFRFLIDWDTGDDYLKQYGTGDVIVGSGNFPSDIWHHLRIYWDCTNDTFKVWHNTNYIDEFTMRYTQFNNVGALNFATNCSNSKNDFKVYLDAIDYSWSDGYFPERSYYYYGEELMGNNTIWESNVIDLEAPLPYYHITVSCAINEKTSVFVSCRMSADNSSWDAWSAWTNGSIALKTYGKRYFQVKVLLTTKNPSQTPTVLSIDVDAYFF